MVVDQVHAPFMENTDCVPAALSAAKMSEIGDTVAKSGEGNPLYSLGFCRMTSNSNVSGVFSVAKGHQE